MNAIVPARRAALLALPLPLALAACGGGPAIGVISTPTPPASYKTLDQLSGDQHFETAGITSQFAPGTTPTHATNAFGSGVTLDYSAASDSYTLTAPGGGTTVTMTTGDIVNAQSTATSTVYQKTAGNILDQVTIARPQVNGVTLSYTSFGMWAHVDTSTSANTTRLAVGGVPTLASDIPKSGTAGYDMAVGGGGTSGGTRYTLGQNSTGTFSMDFGSGTMSTSMHLVGQVANSTTTQDFGTFSGTGALASGGPGFGGTIGSGTYSGAFSGAFFGPQAAEFGYAWYVQDTSSGADFSGLNAGRKK